MGWLEKIVELLENSDEHFLPASDIIVQLGLNPQYLYNTWRKNPDILGRQCVSNYNKERTSIIYLKKRVDIKQILPQDCAYLLNGGEIVEEICEKYCRRHKACTHYQKKGVEETLASRASRWHKMQTSN